MKIMLWLSFSCLAALLYACSSGERSPLDGAALVAKRCSVCHSTDRIKSQRMAKGEWATTVSRMIGHGAKVSNAEQQVLVDFLSQTYHP